MCLKWAFWDILGQLGTIFPRYRLIEKNAFRTDQRTDGPTDRRTDRPYYRDAWTHLKSVYHVSGRVKIQTRVSSEIFTQNSLTKLNTNKQLLPGKNEKPRK